MDDLGDALIAAALPVEILDPIPGDSIVLLVAGLKLKNISRGVKIANRAKNLGFKPTNYISQGQKVFKKGRKYISFDKTAHNGVYWKMANSVGKLNSRKARMGTFDKNLNRLGD
jgi:hypothetical protein